MTRAAAFAAELVRTTSRGLAGLAAARFFETVEDAESRYGENGFDSWREAMGARIDALSAALEAGDATIFNDDVLWFRGIATSRDVEASDVEACIVCLRETLIAQLPEGTADEIVPLFDAAAEALQEGDPAIARLAPGSDAEELFDLALVGDLSGARHFLIEGLRAGRFGLQDAITAVLLPAAREAGRRWHLGEMGVAAEHVITSTLRSALHSLTTALPRPEPNGKAAFVASVPGDAHDTGLVAFALLLEQDGWRVALAGADTPADEIDATAEGYECDLVAVSATLSSQRHALATYLAKRESSLPVLVGGAAIKGEEDAVHLGADGFAPDLAEGVERARQLVGL
ncbi:MAG: cobalamin-dependent protein [Planctomycetota bacterium]